MKPKKGLLKRIVKYILGLIIIYAISWFLFGEALSTGRLLTLFLKIFSTGS